ncbi:MAG: hypothetical protein K6T75_11395 [Acetobacteraceae bacterium]|nr:hypothetical protein [Acetobacteraceae bacterium]
MRRRCVMRRRGVTRRPEITKGAQPPGDIPATFAWMEPDELRQRAEYLNELGREPAADEAAASAGRGAGRQEERPEESREARAPGRCGGSSPEPRGRRCSVRRDGGGK